MRQGSYSPDPKVTQYASDRGRGGGSSSFIDVLADCRPTFKVHLPEEEFGGRFEPGNDIQTLVRGCN